MATSPVRGKKRVVREVVESEGEGEGEVEVKGGGDGEGEEVVARQAPATRVKASTISLSALDFG